MSDLGTISRRFHPCILVPKNLAWFSDKVRSLTKSFNSDCEIKWGISDAADWKSRSTNWQCYCQFAVWVIICFFFIQSPSLRWLRYCLNSREQIQILQGMLWLKKIHIYVYQTERAITNMAFLLSPYHQNSKRQWIWTFNYPLNNLAYEPQSGERG